MTSLSLQPLRDDLRWMLDQTRTPPVRPISQWVEEEIRLPEGPYKGEPYRHARHPASRLWFDEIDSGRWNRFAATGPTQNGKTLMCYVCPVLWHLFELQETVIIGLPTMDMANDKYSRDFLPTIEASQYRSLLPLTGEGSRGGLVKREIKFRNGATLRFMSGGGRDQKRAGYTSRVLAVTEVDGLDESGDGSREADKIEQLEGRTRAFGRRGKQIYLECTASIETGRIWQEWTGGTQSRIVRPCPHCGAWVTPEREHLVGWQEAVDEEQAAELAHFVCPECEAPWSESDRFAAAEQAILVHRGQEVTPEGKIVGEPPRTKTLGFRWSAIDNPFATAGDLGAEEWLALRQRNRENAERKMHQQVWCLPAEPTDIELITLDPEALQKRVGGIKKGIVPSDCVGIAIGVDTGKRVLHWQAMATRGEAGAAVIDYGRQPVESDTKGVRKALVEALWKLFDYFEAGWSKETGGLRGPDQVWIDSGYHEHTDAVYEFCTAANAKLGLPPGSERYRPTKGYGEGQRGTTSYRAPTGRHDVAFVGEEYHIGKVRRKGKILSGVLLVHINADHWKSEFHQRLTRPADEAGAIVLYQAAAENEHATYTAQVSAEVQKEKWIPGKGTRVVWERVDRNNHYLDCGASATTASDFVLHFVSTAAEAAQQTSQGGWFDQQRQGKGRTR